MTAPELASALGGKKRGSQYWAKCPAHEDNHPSLEIGTGRNGSVIVKCWAGCDQREILRTLHDMGLWETSSEPRPVIDYKELRKAELWKSGMLAVLDARLWKISERIGKALDRDEDPSEALQAACRADTALRLRLVFGNISSFDLIAEYKRAVQEDAKLAARCVVWAQRRNALLKHRIFPFCLLAAFSPSALRHDHGIYMPDNSDKRMREIREWFSVGCPADNWRQLLQQAELSHTGRNIISHRKAA